MISGAFRTTSLKEDMAPFSFDMHRGEGGANAATLKITSALMGAIAISTSKVQQWAEFERDRADVVAETYRLSLLEEQASVDSLVSNFLSVQLERGLNIDASARENQDTKDGDISREQNDLKEKKDSLDVEIARLTEGCENSKKLLSDTAVEECKQRARANEARALKERVREAKQITVDDLTRGIVNYKFLGLDFEKTNVENELRFYFSRLDPADPDRLFSFVLQVDEDDKYELVDCLPSIEAATLFEITRGLNATDDMSALVRNMRRAFVATVVP